MERIKHCPGCNQMLPFEAFYRDTKQGIGVRARCKKCESRQAKAKRIDPAHRSRILSNEFKYRMLHRNFLRLPRHKKRKHAYRSDPLKMKCRRKLRTAVERGRIVRPSSCERCGKACKPQAHHHDYSKPLFVQWLCPICHSDAHLNTRQRCEAFCKVKGIWKA